MILRDLKEGRESAFKELYEAYYHSLYNMSAKILRNRKGFAYSSPDDIVSDSMIYIYNKREKFTSVGGAIRYLFISVKYKSLQVLGKEKKSLTHMYRMYMEADDVIDDTNLPIEKKSSINELRHWVVNLPDFTKKYVLLSYFEGLTDLEIHDTENNSKGVKHVVDSRCRGVKILCDFNNIRNNKDKRETVELMLASCIPIRLIERELGIHRHVITLFNNCLTFDKVEYGTLEGERRYNISMKYATDIQKKIAPLLLKGYTASDIGKAVGMKTKDVWQARKILSKKMDEFLTFYNKPNPFEHKKDVKQIA